MRAGNGYATSDWPKDIRELTGASGADCGNFWTALSAVATVAAVGVALLLPGLMARREWKRRDQERREEWTRQDQLRAAELAERKAERTAVIHEVCSAVDQILAFREAAISLAKTKPPFLEPTQSLARISANTTTLSAMLDVLKKRPELTDGATYSAVAAQRIATIVIEQTKPPYGQTMNDWINRVAALELASLEAGLVEKRVTGVRTYAELEPSVSAAKIRAKYEAMRAEIVAALAEQRAPMFGPLDTDHF